MVFVEIQGLNIKYSFSKISESTKIFIFSFTKPKGGILQIIAFKIFVISS
ncbi:MAG: hypothetical protein LBQ24_07040 [Candidatus Peribacteria bacterium]|jgi:hypothetical protein|nr:hypothetical protein [Candidatus Peribacteria bacterium]